MSVAKQMPVIESKLRHIVTVPECIYNVSGININGKRVKSLVFSTDVAIIANCNADAVIAVYPFTPTLQITKSIIEVAQNTSNTACVFILTRCKSNVNLFAISSDILHIIRTDWSRCIAE